ncbi:MAG: polysaccharide biosynthesis C-terminal domain-containing protein, partial [Cytophagaceae bacterium]|nr:polysaccharide biosynthesis C-terminal domain-containing protein [Cytophagaceae bacterium]
RWDWAVLRRMLDYGYPIMLMGLAGSVTLLTDRLVLERFLPEGFYPGRTAEEALGIYGNCYKLSIFMSLAIQAFRYAADPFFFSRTGDKNAPNVFADVMHWFIIAGVLIWVGVSLNLDFIGTFFRKEIYREGLGVVPILLLGNLFLGVYYNLSVWFKLTDKTQYGTLITGIGAVSTLILNILLIPLLGYTGSALAFLASCVLMAVICYGLGDKHFPVPYRLLGALGYIGSAGLLIYLSSLVRIPDLWLAVPFHLLLCGLYFACIVLVERNTLLPKRWRKPTLATAAPSTSTVEKGVDPASSVGEGSFEDEVIH